MIIQYNTLSSFDLKDNFDLDDLFFKSEDLNQGSYDTYSIKGKIFNNEYVSAIQSLNEINLKGNWMINGTFRLPNVPSMNDPIALSSAITKDWCNKILISKLTELSNNLYGSSNVIPSYVGQVIISRSLSSSNEVCKRYGGVEWKQIKGRFLFGVGANKSNDINTYGKCSANSIDVTRAGRKGGTNKVSIKVNNLPGHTHTIAGCGFGELPEKEITMGASVSVNGSTEYGIAEHKDKDKTPVMYHYPRTHRKGGFKGRTRTSGLYGSPELTTLNEILGEGTVSKSFEFTPKGTVQPGGGNSNGTVNAHNNMPKYQVEYIWERIR